MSLYARMLSYLWPYKWRVAQVLVLSFLVVFLQIGSLGAMKPLFDTLFAGEQADLKVSLRVTGADGSEIDDLRPRPRMPEGWEGRVGKDWTILRDELLVLEGFRREGVIDIPIDLKNKGEDRFEDVRLQADVMGRGWSARVEMPDGDNVEPGGQLQAHLYVTPEKGYTLFSSRFWQKGRPKRVAEWIQVGS